MFSQKKFFAEIKKPGSAPLKQVS
jgi:hypothetical protein